MLRIICSENTGRGSLLACNFPSPARFNCHSLVGCSEGEGWVGGMMMFAHELTGVYTFFK